jgi:precorrin-2 dehydrogenase/sirohydrochlorin ferrochelatase
MARGTAKVRNVLYPISVDVRGTKCVVVGGGAVAARKMRALVECGAKVVVVAPEICSAIAALVGKGRVAHKAKKFSGADLKGALLAIAATDDEEVNRAVAAAARRNRALVNVVDVPKLCDFQVPAVLRRGPIVIAVSSGGASPALAARLRDVIGQTIGPEYGRAARAMARVRQRLKDEVKSSRERGRILSQMAREMARQEQSRGRKR